MAGSMAREGDQTTGHGSFAPSIFLPGSSLCQLAQIEGKPMLTVDVIVASHGSPSPSPPCGPSGSGIMSDNFFRKSGNIDCQARSVCD